jgi:hypothetical protein
MKALLTKTKGLRTVVDNAEIDYVPSGLKYLSEAVNVQISDGGKVVRRRGYILKASGNYQSSFNYMNISLVVSGDSLYRLNPDYSTTLIKSGLTSGALYDYAGVNEEIYYVNGHEIGIVDRDAQWKSWSFSQYVGPVKNKVFGQPPAGHLLTYLAGRMFVAVDNAVYYSEPFFHAAFDYARNFLLFPSRIRLLKAIPDGLIVGTEQEIFFISGRTPAEFTMDRVADYPALINLSSNNMIDGQYLLNGKAFSGPCAIVPTTKGICIGGKSEGGYFINISMDKVDYPSALYCSVMAQKDKILILINE